MAFCFAGSLDAPAVEPVPAWSLDELDEDAGGVAALLELDDGGVAVLLELDGLDGALVEPEAALLFEGDDGEVAVEPVEPAPEPLDDMPLEPRSQPANAAPNATDTTTAKIESFM